MDVANGDGKDSVVVTESIVDDTYEVSRNIDVAETESAEIDIDTESAAEPEKRRRTEEQEGEEKEDKSHRKSKRSKKVWLLHL